jgi:hypothetical protein
MAAAAALVTKWDVKTNPIYAATAATLMLRKLTTTPATRWLQRLLQLARVVWTRERLIVRRRRWLWRFCSISLIAGESLSGDFFVSLVIIKFIPQGKDCHPQER